MDLVQIANWIGANWGLITLLAFGLTVLILALSDWLNLNSQLKDLFLLAEKALADHLIKNGPEAMKTVIFALYAMLPLRVTIVLKLIARAANKSDVEILQWIAQRLYDTIKDTWVRDKTMRALSEGRPWCTFVKRKL